MGAAAIEGGVGASGFGGTIASQVGASGFLGNVVAGAVGSAVSQGIGVATGLQDKFSFVGVAAAGIGAGVGAAFGEAFGGVISRTLGKVGGETFGAIGANIASGVAGGLANAATRSALNGSSFQDNFKAAIPDIVGQAIGSAIAGGVGGALERQLERISRRSPVIDVDAPPDRLFLDGPNGVGNDAELILAQGEPAGDVVLRQDTVEVTGTRRGPLGRLAGGFGFGAGFAAGLGVDAVKGGLSLLDFARDVSGSVLFGINETARLVPGAERLLGSSASDPFGQSFADLVNVGEVTLGLGQRAVTNPVGLASDIGRAFNAATLESNAKATAFERGFTNPTGKVLAGLATLGTAVTKAGVLGKLGRGERGATFGIATSNDYRATFFAANPDLQGNVVVHHAVEQQVLKRYPGLVSESEIHSLENLRGIPKGVNSDVHLSQIRREWNRFYRENSSPSRQQLLDKATEIDIRYGSKFNPPKGQ